MRIISLGPDKLSEWDLKKLPQLEKQLSYEVEELIYWYKDQGYAGFGCLIYRDNNDNWHIQNMGHCSCFGPVEDLKSVPMTKKQVLKLLEKEYDYIDDNGDFCLYKELIEYLKKS